MTPSVRVIKSAKACTHKRLLFTLVLLSAVVSLLACSPRFDWRPVTFGTAGAHGVLPGSASWQSRELVFESHTLALTMHTATVSGVLFALGSARLPEEISADPAARKRLAKWATESFYHNAGVAVAQPLPEMGQRFSIAGESAGIEISIEAEILVTDAEWLEAVVIGPVKDVSRAPVEDFWLPLRLEARQAR